MFVHWDILKCSPTERFNLVQEILSGEEKENIILILKRDWGLDNSRYNFWFRYHILNPATFCTITQFGLKYVCNNAKPSIG